MQISGAASVTPVFKKGFERVSPSGSLFHPRICASVIRTAFWGFARFEVQVEDASPVMMRSGCRANPQMRTSGRVRYGRQPPREFPGWRSLRRFRCLA